MSRRRDRPAATPLLEWGDALRTAKARRRTLARRIALGSAGVGLVLLSAALPPRPRFVWNASASAPLGLYMVSPDIPLAPGDFVIARVPPRYRTLAAERHYLPSNVPLVKRVAATAGDEICAIGPQIFIDGALVAVRRAVDGHGRPMPYWQGCHRLRDHQLFLLTDSPASFDGRYFDITESADVIGRARLLWRR